MTREGRLQPETDVLLMAMVGITWNLNHDLKRPMLRFLSHV